MLYSNQLLGKRLTQDRAEYKEVAALQRQGAKQLRARYAEVFGETTAANNKIWLIRRIAWRLQALAEGDLSERARRRAEELANDADLLLSPPRAKCAEAPRRSHAAPAAFRSSWISRPTL